MIGSRDLDSKMAMICLFATRIYLLGGRKKLRKYTTGPGTGLRLPSYLPRYIRIVPRGMLASATAIRTHHGLPLARTLA